MQRNIAFGLKKVAIVSTMFFSLLLPVAALPSTAQAQQQKCFKQVTERVFIEVECPSSSSVETETKKPRKVRKVRKNNPDEVPICPVGTPLSKCKFLSK